VGERNGECCFRLLVGAAYRRGGGESVTRSDRRQREQEFDSSVAAARPAPANDTARVGLGDVRQAVGCAWEKKADLGFRAGETPVLKKETKGWRCSLQVKTVSINKLYKLVRFVLTGVGRIT